MIQRSSATKIWATLLPICSAWRINEALLCRPIIVGGFCTDRAGYFRSHSELLQRAPELAYVFWRLLRTPLQHTVSNQCGQCEVAGGQVGVSNRRDRKV